MSDLPQMPTMTVDEVMNEVGRILECRNLEDMNYKDLVRMITVCNYIQDRALSEIDRRDELTVHPDNGMLIVPDALPEELYQPSPLTGWLT